MQLHVSSHEIRDSSQKSVTSSQDMFSKTSFEPLSGIRLFLSGHHLRTSNPYRPLRTFSRKLSHDILSGLLLSSSQDPLSRHLLRTSITNSFGDLLSRPLSGMRLLSSSQDIFSGLVSRPPSRRSSHEIMREVPRRCRERRSTKEVMEGS